MSGFVLTPSLAHCTCCLSPMPVDGAFVRRCKRGTLQFVLLKPVLAAVTIALHHEGKFREGTWAVNSGYLWITLVYNFTYSWALFSLLLFYMGTRDLLKPHRPVLKFVCVKSVVFATFWQGVAVGIAVGVGALPGAAAGKAMQNLLLCCEMLPAAVAMAFAFPWREYAGAGAGGGGGGIWSCFGRGSKGGIDAAAFSSGAAARAAVSGGASAGTVGGGVDLTSMRHAISIRDVVADTVHQFAPAYHNYVLYDWGGSGGGGGGNPAESGGISGGGGGKRGSGSGGGTPRTVRAQTFIAVGRETASGIGSKGGGSGAAGAASSPREGGGGGNAAAAASTSTAAGASNNNNGAAAAAAAASAPAPKNPFTIDEEDAVDDFDEEARYRCNNDDDAARDEEAGPLAPPSSSSQQQQQQQQQPRASDLSVAVMPRGALQREASDRLVLDSPLAVAASVPAVPEQQQQRQQQPGFDSVDLR